MTATKDTAANIRPDYGWIMLSALGLTCVVTYLANSLLLDTRIAGYVMGLTTIAIIGFGCFLLATISFGYLWKMRYVTKKGLQGTFISSLVSLVALIVLDSSFSAYIQASTPETAADDRIFDKNLKVMELYPRLYYPTERNFRLHKPGVTVTGTHYGGYYQKNMLQSPTLVRDVLTRRAVEIGIDNHGFREDTPIDSAHIFALGDSFTFGWGVNQEDLWIDIIEKNIGQAVFSLGIHDSSPKQELELLKYVIQNMAVTVDHVLWLIYEGNDLEDSYSETAPPMTVRKKKTGFRHLISNLFRGLKDNSVIHNFRTGRARLAIGTNTTAYNESHEIDGVNLATPVFFSDKLGPAIFHPSIIQRGSQPESYILNHANRPLIDKTFKDMRDLARKNKFDVTVIIAPTNARLHGKYFIDFPELSEEPHFINHVENLSRCLGFTVVNLYDLFQPFANRKLLYFRDDGHWNLEGHRIAARLILQEVFGHK